jgi:hypothetical protein
MTTRVSNLDEASKAFVVLAEAEGANIPFYARLCRSIARTPELHGLLLEAPEGQRLPVLLLAALHDLVLRNPDLPLAQWYPSVTGHVPRADDPHGALLEASRTHREEIVDLVRHRQVQTNEVNRCCAWWWGLSELTASDPRPLYLVEVGASAGLNLLLDRFAYEFRIGGDLDAPPVTVTGGEPGSSVRLGAIVKRPVPAALMARLESPLPPVTGRIGIDQNPLDPSDVDDARWLAACIWPEQHDRYTRMDAALALARRHPVEVIRGDLVAELPGALDRTPPGSHAVVLSSWVLAYLARSDREAFLDAVMAASGPLERAGGRISVLTLEATHIAPWIEPPAFEADDPAELRHSSSLVATLPASGSVSTRNLALCQAHLSWLLPS